MLGGRDMFVANNRLVVREWLHVVIEGSFGIDWHPSKLSFNGMQNVPV